MRVGIASTANDIVHSCPVFVKAVIDGIARNGSERPQIGHVAPKSISGSQMRGVYLPRLAGIKVLVGICGRPAVHVGHLRAVGAHDAPEMSGWHVPGEGRAGWDGEALDERGLIVGDGSAKRCVEGAAAFEGWQAFYCVANDWLGLTGQFLS